MNQPDSPAQKANLFSFAMIVGTKGIKYDRKNS